MNGFADSLDASVSSNMFFASLEGGIDHALSQTKTISPFTRLDYLIDRRASFNQGETPLGFHMDSQTTKSARITIGSRTATVWQLGKQTSIRRF